MISNIEGVKRLAQRSQKLCTTNVKKKIVDANYIYFSNEISKYYPDAWCYLKYAGDNYTIETVADELWFREYGTGYIGRGRYPGQLPTIGLDFFSRKEEQHTNGWVYEYHPATRQKHGWWYGGEFTQGNAPTAGFYYATRYLKMKQATIMQEVLRSIGQ